MPFSLRKLPFLAQLAVIENMDWSAILNLSFCSSRMANTISAAKFRKIRRVMFSEAPRILIVYVEDQDKKLTIMGSVNLRTPPSYDCAIVTKLGNEKISSKCRKNDDGSHKYFYEHDPTKNVLTLFAEHVLRILKSPKFPIYACFDNCFDPSSVIPEVEQMRVRGTDIDERCVEFIKSHPNLKYLKTETPFTVDPMFSGISHLTITNTGKSANMILNSVGGKSFNISGAEFGRTEILEFITKWMSGDGYQTVENVLLKFKDYQPDFDWDPFMDEIALSDWDEDTPSRMYTIYSPVCRPETFETNYYRDIRRKSDEQLASFMVFDNMFVFVVWK